MREGKEKSARDKRPHASGARPAGSAWRPEQRSGGTVGVIRGAGKRRWGGESEASGRGGRFPMDLALSVWQIQSMPGRHYSDGESGGSGLTLASTVLRALGHGCLIAAAGMGVAAMCGLCTAVGIGSVAVAGVLGTGCMIAADAARSAAILANAERKRATEEQQYREDDAVLAFEHEMTTLDAAEAAKRAGQASIHVEQLSRQQAQQARSTGKGV